MCGTVALDSASLLAIVLLILVLGMSMYFVVTTASDGFGETSFVSAKQNAIILLIY